jgi:hypothetical protein
MIIVPAIAEQLLIEPNGVDYFRDIEIILTSGAPFTSNKGKGLSEVVDLVSPFGTTEIFAQPELAGAPEA